MKLVTYNIQYSKGKDERYDLSRIVDALDGADIITLQEVERHWPRTGMVDQAAEISALMPGYYWVYGPAFDMDASEKSDDGTVNNRRRQFGNMILARWPLTWTRSHTLPKQSTVDKFDMDMPALEAVVDAPGGPIRVWSIHLSSISSRERMMQVEYLLALHERATANGATWTGPGNVRGDTEWSAGKDAPAMPDAAVWMGDFNAQPDGPEYAALVGPKDPIYGRVPYADRFADAWVAAGHDEADGKTFPHSSKRDFPEMRLDYCFVSAGLAGRVKSARVDEDAQGSDHQPLWVDLAL